MVGGQVWLARRSEARVWSRVRLDVAALSDTGRMRPRNEDALLVRPEKRLYAVADGMGGHVAGEVASGLAVATLDDEIPADAADSSAPQLVRLLVDSMLAANERILERGRTEPHTRGMGTTLTAMAVPRRGSSLALAHVGDSRAYRFRLAGLERLTRDHTWVQEQVDAGRLDPDKARGHPYANVLSRVLGLPDLDSVESRVVDVRSGDVLLLCSDGLTTVLDESAITRVLSETVDLHAAAAALVEAANAEGGPDNVTVLLVRVTDADSS